MAMQSTTFSTLGQVQKVYDHVVPTSPPKYAFDEVSSTLQRAEMLSGRIESLVEKLLGSMSDVSACPSVPPRPEGLLYGLLDDASRADRRISDALSALTRLESTVGAHNVR